LASLVTYRDLRGLESIQKAYLEHAKMNVPAVRFDDPFIEEVTDGAH
jgi:hypothetical protein